MQNIFRSRVMLKIILRRMRSLEKYNAEVEIMGELKSWPDWELCVRDFKSRQEYYNNEVVKKVQKYLLSESFVKLHPARRNNKTVSVAEITSDGYTFLSLSGYWNKQSDSISKIGPIISILISIGALIVAIMK